VPRPDADTLLNEGVDHRRVIQPMDKHASGPAVTAEDDAEQADFRHSDLDNDERWGLRAPWPFRRSTFHSTPQEC
jgi:hypothetical protein